MHILRIGGAYGLLLSSAEFADILETVEAYCIGDTSPSVAPDPEIAEYYPGERFTSPVDERFWRLHATLANRKANRAEGIEASAEEG